jgi:hypothetical protein
MWVGRPGLEPGTYGLKELSSGSPLLWPALLSPQLRPGALFSLVSQGSHWQIHWQAARPGGAASASTVPLKLVVHVL